jgi:hypothetical protein
LGHAQVTKDAARVERSVAITLMAYLLKVYRLTAFEKQFVLSFMAVKSLEGLRGTCWPALLRSRKELNHPFILSSRGQP